jgi:hypothetical protein
MNESIVFDGPDGARVCIRYAPDFSGDAMVFTDYVDEATPCHHVLAPAWLFKAMIKTQAAANLRQYRLDRLGEALKAHALRHSATGVAQIPDPGPNSTPRR